MQLSSACTNTDLLRFYWVQLSPVSVIHSTAVSVLSIFILHHSLFFFFNDRAPPEISPLPLPDPLPIARRRYLPDLTSDNRQRREMAERMALNAPIQGSAADVIKVAMLAVDSSLAAAGLRSRMLLQRSEEHTSELQSLAYIACRLLLAKK